MWAIRGLGTDRGHWVKLLDVCAPCLLTGSVLGADRIYTATGRNLHAVYVIDHGKVRPAAAGLGGDTTDAAIEVHFDLVGPLHLNWPGSLYLCDGDPNVEYRIETSVLRCAPQFSWHPLTTRAINPDLPYRIAKHHSRIRATRQAVGFTLGPITGTLDHIPIPCVGDDLIVFDQTGVTFITEWWG
ncbi:hypothetical protein [Polyangium sp. 6x1]|uniref:hypothetical protein n=1 Tax=Polyangium sp. 6x1 TaxID=3042689 RepID=UPI002482FDDA|nr:hypothetical protein [Polyangium sp. 6x1]MDI1451309.1 hypothetical protein [Polyangium sp. 6x1]